MKNLIMILLTGLVALPAAAAAPNYVLCGHLVTLLTYQDTSPGLTYDIGLASCRLGLANPPMWNFLVSNEIAAAQPNLRAELEPLFGKYICINYQVNETDMVYMYQSISATDRNGEPANPDYQCVQF